MAGAQDAGRDYKTVQAVPLVKVADGVLDTFIAEAPGLVYVPLSN